MKKAKWALFSFLSGYITAWIVKSHRKIHSNAPIRSSEDERLNGYYTLLNKWLELSQHGKSLSSYFEENHYQKIIVYGMGELGQRFCDDLKGTDLEIKYAIDQNAEEQFTDLELYSIHDTLPEFDVIVVTPIFAYEEIRKQLNEMGYENVIALDEVIYSVLYSEK